MKNSFFIKLLTIYFLIFFAFSCAIGFFVWFGNYRKSQDERKSHCIQTVVRAQQQFASLFSAASAAENDLFSDEKVIDYIKFPEVDYYKMLKLEKHLSGLSMVYAKFGFRIGFSKVTDGYIVFPTATGRISDFLFQFGIEDEEREKFWAFVRNENMEEIYAADSSYDQSEFLLIAKWITTNEGYKSVLFTAFLKDFLLPIPNSDKGCFVVREGSEIIITAGDGVNSEDLQSLVSEYSSEENQNAQTPILLNRGKKITAYTVSSIYLPWKIDYVTESFAGISIGEMWQIFFILVALMAVCTAVAFLLTNRLYNPVAQLMIFIERSGTNEFEAIMSYIKKLGLDKQFMLNELRVSQRDLRDKFILDMLSGLVEKEQINEKLDSFDLLWMRDGALPVRLEADTRDKVLYDQVLFAVFEHLKGHFVYTSVRIEQASHIILVKCRDTAYVKRIFLKCLVALEEKMEIDLHAIIGEFSDLAEGMPENFKQIQFINEYNFSRNRRLIMTTADPGLGSQIYYPIDMEKTIITEATDGDLEKARSVFESILRENIVKRDMSGETVYQFMFLIISTISRVIWQIDSSVADVFGKDLILFGELKMSIPEGKLLEKSMEIFDILLEYISLKRKKDDVGLSEQMLGFIKKNYGKDISRIDLAEHFGFSESSISRLFKQATGENFNAYLNIYRVSKAVEMLENTTLTVEKISEKTGFNNSRNLRRVFKRYEGISPEEYRRFKKNKTTGQ